MDPVFPLRLLLLQMADQEFAGRLVVIAGVPFGVKDIVDTFDMPTEWGTPIHKGRQPERDAAWDETERHADRARLAE